MDAAPFESGDIVKCRDVGVGNALQTGQEYVIQVCATIGRQWMVQICGPHGFNTCGARTWYMARRFVRKGKPQ